MNRLALLLAALATVCLLSPSPARAQNPNQRRIRELEDELLEQARAFDQERRRLVEDREHLLLLRNEVEDELLELARELDLERQRLNSEKDDLLRERTRLERDHALTVARLESQVAQLQARLEHQLLHGVHFTWDLQGTPLSEVLAAVGERTDLRWRVDRELESLPVTLSIQDASLGEALHAVCGRLGLRWSLTPDGIAVERAQRTLTDSGIEIHDSPQEGDRDAPGGRRIWIAGKVLVVRYRAWLEDWTPLESSWEEPLRVRIGAGEVAPGLEEVLASLQHTGRRRALIPAGLASGGPAAVPVGAPVRYELELVGEDWSADPDPDASGRREVTLILESRPVTLNFPDTPLVEVVQFLQDISGLNIVLWPGATQGAVNLRVREMPLDQALKKILDQVGLTWTYWSGALVLHPPATPLGPRTPTVRDPATGLPAAVPQRLHSQTINVNFDGTPGPEAIDFLRDLTGLNVVASRAASALLPELTCSLRMRDLPLDSFLEHLTAPVGLAWCVDEAGDVVWILSAEEGPPPPPSHPQVDDPALQAVLQRPITLNCPDTPLPEVAQFLQDVLGCPVVLEDPDDAETVSLRLRQLQLPRLLDVIAHATGRTWRAEHGRLLLER
jgi:FKBP-type peptidyl-prolyl cis-trans isomerase